jgi:hypothetical protein
MGARLLAIQIGLAWRSGFPAIQLVVLVKSWAHVRHRIVLQEALPAIM